MADIVYWNRDIKDAKEKVKLLRSVADKLDGVVEREIVNDILSAALEIDNHLLESMQEAITQIERLEAELDDVRSQED